MKLFEWLKCAYILFIVCVLKRSVFVEGDYIFTIQLRSYSNPENRLASGTCCGDSEEAGMCPTPCNTTLRLCFRNANQARDDPDCPILEIIGDADPRGLNPSIQGPWPGVVQLHISATSTNAELIDNFFIELNVTANDPLSPTQEYSGENRTAMLQLQFQVTCAFNYFGLDCNTFCLDRNDTAAHFTCGDSGEIVCLPGYQNESSNCTQCAPAEGCSPTGGFCVLPGECRCQPGYSGENCAIGPILTSTPTVAPSSTLTPSLVTIVSGTTSFSSTTTLLSTDVSRIASTTLAIHDTSVPSGGSSSHTDVILITATQSSIAAPEVSSSLAVDMNMISSTSTVSAIHGTSIPSGGSSSHSDVILITATQSSIAAPEVSSSLAVDMNMIASTSSATAIHGTSIPSGGSSSHSDVILITAVGVLLQSSTVTQETLPMRSSTSSPTTQSPLATPFITPGVGTVLREDSPSLVLLIVGLTVGGGLLILLSAVIFLIALTIFLKRKKRQPKWRKYIYETADTTREETMSPRYIDHSSEHFNGSPAYALLAHAVANLDQPPPNRNSLPDPTYSTFQEDREDTASGQETCMTSTTELWDESEDCPMVAGTPSEDTDPNQCSAERIYADEEKFDLSLHQTPDSREEDSDIDLPVIGNPGATLADDVASSWDDHPLAAEESANGDPKAKDLVYAELDHQPTHSKQLDNTGQKTVHQTMQGPTPPMVTYVDVLHNTDDQSEAKPERTQMTIKSLV